MNFNLQSKDLDTYFVTNFDPLVSLLKLAAAPPRRGAQSRRTRSVEKGWPKDHLWLF